MDYETCDILDIQVVDKREADLKSTNMEKIAFLRALETLEKSDVKVEEVVTDAHPQIKSYLSKQLMYFRRLVDGTIFFMFVCMFTYTCLMTGCTKHKEKLYCFVSFHLE